MRRSPTMVLCSVLAVSMTVFGGCGKKNEEETQIKQLITGTPTPTVQPEADNPENTQTTDGISMTNDYLNQKEAGEVPSIKDNKNVSASEGEDGTSQQDGQGEDTDSQGNGEDSQDESGES